MKELIRISYLPVVIQVYSLPMELNSTAEEATKLVHCFFHWEWEVSLDFQLDFLWQFSIKRRRNHFIATSGFSILLFLMNRITRKFNIISLKSIRKTLLPRKDFKGKQLMTKLILALLNHDPQKSKYSKLDMLFDLNFDDNKL